MTQMLLRGGSVAIAAAWPMRSSRAIREFRFAPWPGRTTGYIVDTVQTVFDAFFRTASFEDCLVDVVNRGGDADTTGALAGQLAGALYGLQAIPARWLRRLDPRVNVAIRIQTAGLLALAARRTSCPATPVLLPT
jgi:ADP-ribosyl-[dinitrogen reductase] hydrolase